MRKRARKRRIVEWERREDNVGTITTRPCDYLRSYLFSLNVTEQQIIDLFWDASTRTITLLDFCTLTRFWWLDKDIRAARLIIYEHPTHHHSEYIFDKEHERLIVRIKNPDLLGEHWRAQHLHLLRGLIHNQHSYLVSRPNFDQHIEIRVVEVVDMPQELVDQAFKFVMKIK